MGIDPVHRAGQLATGWLGDHTASIDWCEDNYVITDYIAEFWNTLSNIPFVFLGVYGAYRALSNDLPHKSRFALMHAFIAVIGIGSSIFHLTLKWYAQVVLDELPMIFSASTSLYVLLVSRNPNATSFERLRIKLLISIIPILVSVTYVGYGDPLFHQICFGGLLISTTLLVQSDYKAPQLSPQMAHEAKLLNMGGAAIFLAGFAIWNLDNIFCESLTGWRGVVGEYVGVISQGHAWWHLLTGLGGSRLATGITYLMLSKEFPGQFEVVGLNTLLPYVRRVSPGTSNGFKQD
ncbi:alkaline phytoceramidase [Clavulina sp. PMI_390]|nr:alkaline phytoceramidase [Clavulina sp. PMI_390]